MVCRIEMAFAEPMVESLQQQSEEFKSEVMRGLSRRHKRVPSRFFYDANGSDLFDQITRHPDYYVTNCELEILHACREAMAELFGDGPFNLVEFGPGDGSKPAILIDLLLQRGVAFTYMPIDVSYDFLDRIVRDSHAHWPSLEVTALHADFLTGLRAAACTHRRNVVIFLGASIGNYSPREALRFLSQVCEQLNPGDLLLTGFDLCKDIKRMIRAYNDSAGITRRFNLNLLARMNRELGADFDLDAFEHYEPYNVLTQSMESYLVSLKDQTVGIAALERSFLFRRFEPVHVEFSQKYQLPQIETLATQAGFRIVEHFFDSKRYFIDSLWVKWPLDKEGARDSGPRMPWLHG